MELSGTPRVSVVVPNLDQGRYLGEALDSVLAQDYPGLDLFVADGGSRDESLAVLRRYGARVAWASGPDGGQAASLRAAFARATGDVLAWLNADDVWAPGAVARAIAALQATPDAPFVYGGGERIDAAGRVVAPFSPARPFDGERLRRVENYVLQPTVFMRAAAYREAGGLDCRYRWGLDWDLWLRLCRLGAPVYVAAVQAQAREHGAAKTARGGFRRYAELLRILRRHGALWSPAARIYGLDTLRKRWPGAFGASTLDQVERLRGRLMPRVCWPIHRLVASWIAAELAAADGAQRRR